jgi:outer membrane protein TolC
MVRLFCYLIISLLFWSQALSSRSVGATEAWSLLHTIDLTLSQSDAAYDLQDGLMLSTMETQSAEHRFATRLVPLTNFGVRQGTGSQQLGLEFRKETGLGSSIAYGMVGNRIDESTGYVVENSTNAKAYVRVSQGLFRRWGTRYNLNDLSIAQLRAKEQEIKTERARQTLILGAVKKFYDLVLAEQLLAKAERSLARNREHLASAVSRQSVGLVSKVDVYRAELAVLDAESARENQLRQKQRGEDGLKELVGISDEAVLRVADTIDKMVPVIPESWEDELFFTRLDWQAYRVGIEINEIETFKAKQNLAPDIGLSLVLEQRGEGDSAEDALTLDQTNWAIQLEMLSSFDTFNEENALLRKKIEKAKLRRGKAALQRKITREAKESFQDLLAEERNHQISMRRLHQAEMALDLAKTRYEKGLSDNLAVLDAETAFSDAEVNISKSMTAYNIAATTLAYNLGVLDRKWLELSLDNSDTSANPDARGTDDGFSR